ncbi:hypothetical protein ACFWBV_14860 [Streptomyces sp. NPDC060030]|uniref:hypothetical protein n=1 Tax=Streptomyces sp. NPDC060030 TaxID=3347042 RepID=UPI00367FDE56
MKKRKLPAARSVVRMEIERSRRFVGVQDTAPACHRDALGPELRDGPSCNVLRVSRPRA